MGWFAGCSGHFNTEQWAVAVIPSLKVALPIHTSAHRLVEFLLGSVTAVIQ